MIELEGIVEKIRFHNPQNGWTVLELSGNSTNQHICVTLAQVGVQVGNFLELEGEWIYDKKYGKQFKAKTYKTSIPSTKDGLLKYLESSLFSTVSKKIAKSFVDKFGEQFEQIVENEPNKLLEIQNFNQEKLDVFIKEWNELKGAHNIIIELENLGISTNMALRLYNQFGDTTLNDIKADPYMLISLVQGIGFKTADTIALRLGFDLNSPERIIAGVKYLLEETLEEGHTFLYEEELLEYLHSSLEITDKESIIETISALVEIGILVKIENKLSLKNAYEAESFIANWIKKKTTFEIEELYDVEQKIESECLSKNLVLSDQQKNSVKTIISKSFSVLTGGAGVGKTTTVKLIIQLLINMNKNVLLCAPTGRAAQRMSEVTDMQVSTIHRLLKWEHESSSFAFNKFNKLTADFIIVDESSMLDIFLAKSLMEAINDQTQLLFIGDPNQLPAVGAGDVLDSIITEKPCPILHLTQIFRQKEDASIINFANQIIKGEVPKIPSPLINPQLFVEKKDCLFIDTEDFDNSKVLNWLEKNRKAIILNNKNYKENSGLSYNDKNGEIDLSFFRDEWLDKSFDALSTEDKERFKTIKPYSSLLWGLDSISLVKKIYTSWIPRYYGNLELQILTPQKKHILGSKNLNIEIQSQVNPASESKKELKIGDIVFREGDKIIQTRNNYQKNIFNGDIGLIEEIKNVENIKVSFGTGDYKRDVVLNKENFYDIELAYAITVHKSQGSEFDCVIVPLVLPHRHMLFRNLIYTAITRGKKVVIFVGSRKALALATKNDVKIIRQTHLKNLLK